MNLDHLPYRRCVGIALFNPQGLVFIGKRKGGPEHTDATHSWQMPQGGIDKGEDPLTAARRELWEETGVTSAELLGEAADWLSYDLPASIIGEAWRGKYRGQTQRWFAFRFTGNASEINIDAPGGHKPEFTQWRWEHLAATPDLIVPFKRPVYEGVVAAFAHLAA